MQTTTSGRSIQWYVRPLTVMSVCNLSTAWRGCDGGRLVHSGAAFCGVPAQQAPRAGRIACGDGPDNRLVLGVGYRKSAAVLESAEPEQQQPLGQQPIGFGQAGVPRKVHEQVVKFQIQRVIALDVLYGGRIIHRGYDRLHVAQLLGRRALGDALADQLVERLAYVVDLVSLSNRYFTDKD